MSAYNDKEKSSFGSDFIDRMNEKFYSLHRQGFAEVSIGEGAPAAEEQAGSEEIRERSPDDMKKYRLFLEMRSLYHYPAYFTTHGQNAELFYRQAKFMENFEDDYLGYAEFSSYFPEYQKMNQEQLRTYFTWRSNVRRGVILKTSFSYVFLYIYELIHNIGTAGGSDGFGKLLDLWKKYRNYELKIDRYMPGWLKDYYITNPFDVAFQELVRQDGFLQGYYEFSKEITYFELYAPLSSYRYEKSAFYTLERGKILAECFQYVVQAIDGWLHENGVYFDDLIYYGSKGSNWIPFSNAMYAMRCMQPSENKSVRISNAEIYRYENGRWSSSQNRIRRKIGRSVIGYILKRIEAFYRKAMKYRHPLRADKSKIDLAQIGELIPDPAVFFQKIDAAILDFYRESQKVSVRVDPGHLEKIRENARKTQEKLLAGQEAAQTELPCAAVEIPDRVFLEKNPDVKIAEPGPASAGPWEKFVLSLNGTEREALRMVLCGASLQEMNAFAKSRFLMLEVLADTINEKAMQLVEDNIIELTDRMTVYEEYQYELERLVLHETE
ncbi:MAG: TerB N-terminal domain-containing protein [Clostridia bacterium]